jgi:drug/metabolite transporter (DMT)-like permease
LIPPAEVAVISLLEVVLGPLLVWLAYAERPATATLIGGVIVTAAVLVQATARLRGGSGVAHHAVASRETSDDHVSAAH